MKARPIWCRSLVRWAGSKRSILQFVLNPIISSGCDKYIEPFVGSGCVFFALHPKMGYLSDLNTELIEFYHFLKAHPRILWRTVNKFPRTEKFYYKIRALNPEDLSPLERASRFLYLNRHCFNGLYRTNGAGKFNVPFGTKTGQMADESLFYRASVALRQAKIKCEDFALSARYARKGTIFYLDPPYDYSGRLDRGEYGNGSFRAEDIPRLTQMLEEIDERGGRFVLSYLKVPEIQEIAQRWNSTSKPVKRQIASFARFRKTINELLITNFKLEL